MPRRWQQQPHLRSAVRDHGQGRERCRSLRAVGGGAASTQELVSARADHDHSVHGGAVSPPLLLVLVLVPPTCLLHAQPLLLCTNPPTMETDAKRKPPDPNSAPSSTKARELMGCVTMSTGITPVGKGGRGGGMRWH